MLRKPGLDQHIYPIDIISTLGSHVVRIHHTQVHQEYIKRVPSLKERAVVFLMYFFTKSACAGCGDPFFDFLLKKERDLIFLYSSGNNISHTTGPNYLRDNFPIYSLFTDYITSCSEEAFHLSRAD